MRAGRPGARVRRGGAAGAGPRPLEGCPRPRPPAFRGRRDNLNGGGRASPAPPPGRSARQAAAARPCSSPRLPAPRGGTGPPSVECERRPGRPASPPFPGRRPGARSQRARLCQNGPAGAEQAPGGGPQAAPAVPCLAVAAEGGAGRRRRGARARARASVPRAQGRREQEGAPRRARRAALSGRSRGEPGSWAARGAGPAARGARPDLDHAPAR